MPAPSAEAASTPPPSGARLAAPFGALRLSFRQSLVIAFLLMAALMGVVSLRGLQTLEGLLTQSRAGAARALQLSADAQQLGEQTVNMQRAARQYLVLGDITLRQGYASASEQASQRLAALAGAALPPVLVQAWREQHALIDAELADRSTPAALRDRSLEAAFAELGALQARIVDAVRQATESRNVELQAELELGRVALARQVLAACAGAMVLALAFGIWLARPLQRVEAAIVDLGENRLDRRIEIRGPVDLRRLGRRLDWLRQRMAALDADRARVLRHVSHELKTPLAALREGVALLEDGVAGQLSADQREVARILAQNTATLQTRIEDLLRINAAAFDAQRLVRRPTELGALIEGLIAEQRLQWRARGLRLKVLGAPQMAQVDADVFGRALANLLSNAIRFSPLGGLIEIRLERRAPGLRIEVADQGPGVAGADRARLFEPFYRGARQPESALAGSGVGLSIVAETVAAHGGRIMLLPDESADLSITVDEPGDGAAGQEEPTEPDPPGPSQAPHPLRGPGACFRIELPDDTID